MSNEVSLGVITSVGAVCGGDGIRILTPDGQTSIINERERGITIGPNDDALPGAFSHNFGIWNECNGSDPILPEAKEGRYIVEGSRGVCLAHYHQRLDGTWVFQDAVTGDDEGMRGYCDEPFSVERWMPLPKGKNIS